MGALPALFACIWSPFGLTAGRGSGQLRTRMKKLEILILSILFFFVLLGVYLARTNPTYFVDVYTTEDGLIESLTTLALFSAALVCFYRVLRLRGLRSKRFLACCALLGVIMLFGAGEEISWGQRILGFNSPEFFNQNNAQMETNLHNMVVGSVKLNKLVFGKLLAIGVGLYLLVLPVVYQRSARYRGWLDNLGVPIARPYQLLSIVALFALLALIPSKKKSELKEFGGCAIFLLILAYPKNAGIFDPRQPR